MIDPAADGRELADQHIALAEKWKQDIEDLTSPHPIFDGVNEDMRAGKLTK